MNCAAGIVLFRRFAQPLGRLAEFLRHARAVQIAHAQITLRHRIALFGRAPEPFHRLLIILRHALAVLKTDAQIALRLRVALARRPGASLQTYPMSGGCLTLQNQS